MKKIVLLLLCLVVMLTLVGCVAANPYNSFQSSVIGEGTAEPSAAVQPTNTQAPQPMDNTQAVTTPTPNPSAPGYNG